MDEPPSFTLLQISFDQGLLYALLSLTILFAIGFTSATEAAFFSLHPDDIDRFRRSNVTKEKRTADLLVFPRLLIGLFTALKFFLLTLIALLFTTSYYLFDTSVVALAVSAVIIAAVIALFGIIIPKIYGKANGTRIAVATSGFCFRASSVLKPIIDPLLRRSEKVERKLEAKSEENTITDLSHALQLAAVENEPTEGAKEILAGIVNFGTLNVKQVMRPRAEISYTDIALDHHQLLDFVRKSGYSRVPVCRNTIDKVEGILYVKDLLPFLDEPREFNWQKLLRPGYFIADTKKVDSLLKEFQEKRVHMALVVGDGNTITGLITLEDIIEEIIGDINDEFDEVGARYQKLNETTFLFDGKTLVQEFLKVVQIDPSLFRPVKGINESLSGLLVEVYGELPSAGEEIIIEPFTFVVENVDRKRIKRIKVRLNPTGEK